MPLTSLREFVRRLWGTLRRNPSDPELEEELRSHLELAGEQAHQQGGTHDGVRRLAQLQAGGVAQAMEALRDQRGLPWLANVSRDVPYAIRTLGRSPSFTATVVLTLALGIGVNTAVFSAMHAVLFRPLPFPEADRLVRLRQTQERTAEAYIAPVRLEDWNRLNVTFDAITGYFMEDASETSGDIPDHVRRAFVTPRFLKVWGMAPAVGRDFTDAEHTTGGPPAVLISDRYWRRRMSGDPHVLDGIVRINRTSYRVIGVMPASFLFPDRDVDLWFPAAVDNQAAQSRHSTWYTGVGRLKPGVTFGEAHANLEAVQTHLAQQYPDTDGKVRVEMTPLKDATIGGVRRSFWLLFGGVSVLLLITCANVAGLLLTRATHRHQEFSVRLALGASSAAVAAQTFVEALLLSTSGAAVGLLVAVWATTLLRSVGAGLPRIDEITIDWSILLYTLGSAVFVGMLCGILPAIRSTRHRTSLSVSQGERTQVSSRNSVQWFLVGGQVALSVVLLVSAGLLVRSFQQLFRVDSGFDIDRVLSFQVSGNWGETANYERLSARIDDTIQAMKSLPGVEAAATAGFLPGVPVHFESQFALMEASSESDRRMSAESRGVAPEYFETMRIPVVQGEPCRRQPFGTPPMVMVNRLFVSRYLPTRSSVIGLHLAAGDVFSRPGVITGIVGDAREAGLDREPLPTVYACISAPNPTPYFLVRTRRDPHTLVQTVRLKIKELDPLRSVYDIVPLNVRIDEAFAQNRLRTVLLGAFALTALALAVLGLYGTLGYIVSRRRREVGLRLALGAGRSRIVRQFLLQALRAVGVACAVGLSLSLAFTRLLTGMLYGVASLDPLTVSTVIAIVVAVATLAALIPASRAALVAPIEVLREG